MGNPSHRCAHSGGDHKDLTRAVADGSFREDLFFRLNVIPIELPPCGIARRLAGLDGIQRTASAAHGRTAIAWRPDALETLPVIAGPETCGNWPMWSSVFNSACGEVAPLLDVRAVIRLRMALLAGFCRRGEWQQAGGARSDAHPGVNGGDENPSLTDSLDAYERQLISRALAATSGNVAEAARRLQTDRPNLYRRMRRLGLAVSGE